MRNERKNGHTQYMSLPAKKPLRQTHDTRERIKLYFEKRMEEIHDSGEHLTNVYIHISTRES